MNSFLLKGWVKILLFINQIKRQSSDFYNLLGIKGVLLAKLFRHLAVIFNNSSSKYFLVAPYYSIMLGVCYFDRLAPLPPDSFVGTAIFTGVVIVGLLLVTVGPKIREKLYPPIPPKDPKDSDDLKSNKEGGGSKSFPDSKEGKKGDQETKNNSPEK